MTLDVSHRTVNQDRLGLYTLVVYVTLKSYLEILTYGTSFPKLSIHTSFSEYYGWHFK
jgi:hypothetical protein